MTEEKQAAELAKARRFFALLPDKERAIKWIESCRDSIPKIPAIKDKDIAYMVVSTTGQIKSCLNTLHEGIKDV